MPRVQYANVVINQQGVPQKGVTVSIAPVAGSSGTSKLWAAETGAAELPSVITNQFGVFSVWLDEGRYDIDPHGTASQRVEAISESTSGTVKNEGVTTEKLAAAAVTGEKIAPETIRPENYGLESIQGINIKALNITTGTIAAQAVTAAKLAAEAVETSKIKLLAITEGLLAARAVTSAKIALKTIKAENIEEKTITFAQIAEETLRPENYGEESIQGRNVKALSLTTGTLAERAVTALKLGEEAVETAKIKNGAVTSEKITPGTTPVGSGEENKVVLGVAGGARKFVAAITGNAAATKFKIKHGLETQMISVEVLSATFEQPVTMLAKAVAISLSEVEVTYTVAPGAKVINYAVIIG